MPKHHRRRACEARNAVFNLKAPASDIVVNAFVLRMTRNGHNFTSEVFTGFATINRTYHIATTYCEPESGPSSTVQLLTHGIGFDRTYWDIRAQDYNHSYVARATDQYGFSTFTWDRLGIAQSQHGTDAVNEIQSALEMPALYALRLRGGKIPGIACTFDKVVHIGHSFGSIQSYSMAVLYPEATDSLVLTGFSQAAGFVPYFQFGSDFLLAKGMAQFSDNPGGYLAAGDVTVVQTDFFSPSCFEPELLELGFASSQPVTVGELLTVGAETGETNLLTAPVLIITGGRDLPFCGGDCTLTGNASLPNCLELSRPMFTSLRKFDAVVVEEAGHGLNLERSHDFTYGKILEFIAQNVAGETK